MRSGANPAYTPNFQFLVEMKEVNLEKKSNDLAEISKKIYFGNDWEDLLRFIPISRINTRKHKSQVYKMSQYGSKHKQLYFG